MALQVCTECGTAYAPAGVCPQCGANHWVDEQEAELLGLYKALNEGDHESISPANPLGIEIKSGDGTVAAESAEEVPATPSATDAATATAEPDEAASTVSASEQVPSDAATTAEIRAWARDQGLQVADSGALPQFVIDEYNKEHGK